MYRDRYHYRLKILAPNSPGLFSLLMETTEDGHFAFSYNIDKSIIKTRNIDGFMEILPHILCDDSRQSPARVVT